MKVEPTAFAERARYRLTSIALILASWVVLSSAFIGVPAWLCFLITAAASVVLAVITYHRLRDAGLSGSWVLLMILPLGIGSIWHLPDHVAVNFGGYLLSCVPVILGWFAPANSGAKPKAESA